MRVRGKALCTKLCRTERLERSTYSSVTLVQEDNQQQAGDEFVQTVLWNQLFPFLHLGFPVCKVGMTTMLTFVLP